jgi:type I restriction enzyme, R subunit
MSAAGAREFDESVAEEALLEWLADLGWHTARGPELVPAERQDHHQVLLTGRLTDAIARLNPDVSAAVREEAVRLLQRVESPSLVIRNRRFHRLLVDGVSVEGPREGGGVRGELVRLVDFAEPSSNDWLAVNQLTVFEGQAHRRADVVLYVNGLPLAIVELKNPADEQTTVVSAFHQLETYKHELPTLLSYNELLVISDGLDARLGTITSEWERFQPWRTIDGAELAPPTANRLEVLARGVFDRHRMLELVRHFIAFEDDGVAVDKKLAAYHQFHATQKAVQTTLRAAGPDGDRRAGVVWHTQGSGKSLTMVFYAGKLVVEPRLANPTVVVLTDRNDLDDQLFGVFARCSDLLRQSPVRASDRVQLRDLLSVAAGGVVFTTIQKFLPEERGDAFPLLSDRSNVVVIADEAHRSQYGFIAGFARHVREALPNATFVGFTGTPIELDDRDTRNVFGDLIDVYDVQRAVEDGATVPIYYESRLAKLDLREGDRPHLDELFEEVTEGEEIARREKLKSRWAQLEAVVGTRHRLELVARDLVNHYEERLAAMEGKAMVVCMSRRICVDLYAEIVKLRPDWHVDADDEGAVKVVMTGAATDPFGFQPHVRSKSRREDIARRFKDADDPLRIVLVRDMWLTGFDVPSLHTMYLDKPMRGHTLMQAIARVNRVFRDKPGGLVVDYLGIADELRRALATYSASGGHGRPALDQEDAVRLLLEKVEVCRGLFHEFDYTPFLAGTASERLAVLPAAQEHVLGLHDGRDRLVKVVVDLSKAFALAVPRDEALAVRDEVAFFQAVKAALVKSERSLERPTEELDHAIRQIVAGAIAPGEVIDVFAAAGLPKPDISILSDEFLAEVRALPQRNLAVELLQKLLHDEVRARSHRNVVQSRLFSQLLEQTVRRYQARAIEAAQVIEELIELAREMREADRRGEELGLSVEELAFYDALAENDSAVEVLGDDALLVIARELVETVRRNATIDWTLRENVRANLRRMVRRILRKHGYPPDGQEAATKLVLEQAATLGLESARVDRGQPGDVLPFHAAAGELRPYENAIPLYSLAAAAGAFADAREVEPEAWVVPNGRARPRPGLFVAQVSGESMNRRIPNGAYCVFASPVEGSRTGRVVLVERRGLEDPEHGGSYTVKLYRRVDADTVELVPDTDAVGYEPLVLRAADANELHVVAELVEVLPGI